MSADCLIILRNAIQIEEIQQRLESFCHSNGCGLLLNPIDALIVCGQVCVGKTDFAFELTNRWNDISSDLLLYPDGISIDGEYATLPLRDRLMLLQKATEIGLQFCQCIDIYLSEDNPFLPEYIVAQLECRDVADFLYHVYQSSQDPYPFIPDVHIHIGESVRTD